MCVCVCVCVPKILSVFGSKEIRPITLHFVHINFEHFLYWYYFNSSQN